MVVFVKKSSELGSKYFHDLYLQPQPHRCTTKLYGRLEGLSKDKTNLVLGRASKDVEALDGKELPKSQCFKVQVP